MTDGWYVIVYIIGAVFWCVIGRVYFSDQIDGVTTGVLATLWPALLPMALFVLVAYSLWKFVDVIITFLERRNK